MTACQDVTCSVNVKRNRMDPELLWRLVSIVFLYIKISELLLNHVKSVDLVLGDTILPLHCPKYLQLPKPSRILTSMPFNFSEDLALSRK
jgi:hypothetical protein